MGLRVVFFGTPQFAATILDALLKNGIEVVAVVTKQDKPAGRTATPLPPPVKVLAEREGIALYQPPKASDPQFVSILETLRPDLYVVAAFSEILKENLLKSAPLGSINVHASILPKYRGAAPIQRAIMAGERESGVTIMAMDVGLDTGGIMAVAKTAISDEMTAGELSRELAALGAEALVKVLHDIEKGGVKVTPQDSSESTYAKKLTPEEGRVDWSLSCEQIHNQIRGVTPKPGAWCWIELRGVKKRFSIKKAMKLPNERGEPGQILPSLPLKLIIGCGQGAIAVEELQLEGKKAMKAEEFLRGIEKEKIKF